MTGSELLTRVRSLIKDDVHPYLWSDEELFDYINEGEREFCTRTHLLLDDTLSVTTADGTAVYDLPVNVLDIYQMNVSTETQALGRIKGSSQDSRIQTNKDQPQYYSLNIGYREVSFYPVPDAVYTVNYIAAVFPLAANEISDSSDPSIPAEYHHLLADYASYMALLVNDVDGANVGTAEKFEERWYMGVRNAKRQAYKYRAGDKVVQRSYTHKVNGYA